jgi:hypothetical protein
MDHFDFSDRRAQRRERAQQNLQTTIPAERTVVQIPPPSLSMLLDWETTMLSGKVRAQ